MLTATNQRWAAQLPQTPPLSGSLRNCTYFQNIYRSRLIIHRTLHSFSTPPASSAPPHHISVSCPLFRTFQNIKWVELGSKLKVKLHFNILEVLCASQCSSSTVFTLLFRGPFNSLLVFHSQLFHNLLFIFLAYINLKDWQSFCFTTR